MSKKHFIRMAEIVRSILDGKWTSASPVWANVPFNQEKEEEGDNYIRAVWTAEAFIILAQGYNPRFDTQRFLVACGLAGAPIKAKKRKA